MLPEIKRVRDEAVKCRANGDVLTLKTLANIFEMCSHVDEIEYIAYDVPPSNPIWGRFTKWQAQKAYCPPTTTCKVQYASHLDEIWRMFVVCKELCHSLYTSDGTHSVSDNSVVELVNTLSLSSAITQGDVLNINPFVAEKLAEFGALEIIVPVDTRKRILQDGGYTQGVDLKRMSEELFCPQCYIEFIFQGYIIEFSEKVL